MKKGDRPITASTLPDKLSHYTTWRWQLDGAKSAKSELKEGIRRFRTKFGRLPRLIVVDRFGLTCWHSCLMSAEDITYANRTQAGKRQAGRSTKRRRRRS